MPKRYKQPNAQNRVQRDNRKQRRPASNPNQLIQFCCSKKQLLAILKFQKKENHHIHTGDRCQHQNPAKK